MSDPQQEYIEALAGYRDALARLQEAKRHVPQSPRDRFRQRQREKREAARAHYLANKEAIDAEHNEWLNRITAKAIAVLHQKVNAIATAEETGAKIGQSLRIRLPVTYRINDGPPIGNDDE
jgi:hypothetical protein